MSVEALISTEVIDTTLVGRSVMTAANAAAARTAIGAGTGSGDVVAANNLSDLASASGVLTIEVRSLRESRTTFSPERMNPEQLRKQDEKARKL
jgi:hypothetical protein